MNARTKAAPGKAVASPETTAQTACRQCWTRLLAADGATVGWDRDKSGRYRARFAENAVAAWNEAFKLGQDSLREPLGATRAEPAPLFGDRAQGWGTPRAELSAQIESDQAAEAVENVLDEVAALFYDHALETWSENEMIVAPEAELRETLRAVLLKAIELMGKDRDTSPKR